MTFRNWEERTKIVNTRNFWLAKYCKLKIYIHKMLILAKYLNQIFFYSSPKINPSWSFHPLWWFHWKCGWNCSTICSINYNILKKALNVLSQKIQRKNIMLYLCHSQKVHDRPTFTMDEFQFQKVCGHLKPETYFVVVKKSQGCYVIINTK